MQHPGKPRNCLVLSFIPFSLLRQVHSLLQSGLSTKRGLSYSFQYPLASLTLILPTWRIWWAPNNSSKWQMGFNSVFNPLTPNDLYVSRTAPLTSKCCILYIYSTNVGTEYFKHSLYSPFFSLQNAVCFIMLTCLVPVLFTFYIEGVQKFKKK